MKAKVTAHIQPADLHCELIPSSGSSLRTYSFL